MNESKSKLVYNDECKVCTYTYALYNDRIMFLSQPNQTCVWI